MNSKPRTIWHRLMWLPVIVSTLGTILVIVLDNLVHTDRFDVGLIATFAIAELVMLMCGLGIVSFLNIKSRSPLVVNVLRLNIFLFALAGIVGFNAFIAL